MRNINVKELLREEMSNYDYYMIDKQDDKGQFDQKALQKPTKGYFTKQEAEREAQEINKKRKPQDRVQISSHQDLRKQGVNLDGFNESVESVDENSSTRYMFFSNLEQIKNEAEKLLSLDKEQIEQLLNNGHDWAADHIATAKESIDQVFDFIMNGGEDDESLDECECEDGDMDYDNWSDEDINELSEYVTKGLFELYDRGLNESDDLYEAEYRGRKVKLNKPMAGDVKKFKVYVKNDKGNVVKVNFGQKGVRIKKKNPKRRKSFRARHKCNTPGPKYFARYWSCKKW
jgi:hypothetical protein